MLGSSGYELLIESVIRDVLALLYSIKPSVIYLSDRFSRILILVKGMNKRFENIFDMLSYKPLLTTLESRGKVAKQATEGAVIIANGLADERYKKLVDVLKLRESKGTIFDYVIVIDKD